MGNSATLAPLWAANRSALHERKIEHQLQRFQRRHRLNVIAMAGTHPAVRDLAFSFPALLFLLSVPHKGIDTAVLQNLVIAGVPLKSLARHAGLPWWTRKLPPESFGRPLLHLPRQSIYAQQIVNHLPRRSRLAGRWLNNVMSACEYGDEAFAVWLARECGQERFYGSSLQQLALWAWFSARPNLLGYTLVDRPWRPEVKRLAARKAAREWRNRMCLHVTIGDAVLEPLWLEAKSVHGFDFVPLLSASAIHEEAQSMENCVRSYGSDIATNSERLWSMRRDGGRVATLSVGNHHDLDLLTITEIKGPKNARVSRDVAVAAKRWIDSIDVTTIEIGRKHRDDVLPSTGAWVQLFKPYWMEKRRIPSWLPLVPTAAVLGRL